MSSSQPPIHRPKPRRLFENGAAPPQPPSPQLQPLASPSRTQSFLNLTSSTLLGIYIPTGYNGDASSEAATPWGTGAQTPRTPSVSGPSLTPFGTHFPSQSTRGGSKAGVTRRRGTQSPSHFSSAPRKRASVFAFALRSVLLFSIGMGYGLLVRHLHDDRQLAPFQPEGIIRPRSDGCYLAFWGVAGVGLGTLMPWVDTLFLGPVPGEAAAVRRTLKGSEGVQVEPGESEGGVLGADWTPVVRSVGAFVGIAYAIRKLPWASPLQVSLTLFLVNPVLWYILDQSSSGFLLSAFVSLCGTMALLLSNPDMMPSPAAVGTTSPLGIPVRNVTGAGAAEGDVIAGVDKRTIEVGVWTLSVLFCSCVCFGNVGRRLALRGGGVRR